MICIKIRHACSVVLNVYYRFEESTNKLEAVAEFPGLPIWYTLDNGVSWSEYQPEVVLDEDQICKTSELQLLTR